ncbi:hypothetical protein BDV59DRAFT_139144 [Aspergillus ambiguus]|uniref:DMT family transporter n=1 Tax=Aspergillus ambiguus TaxID=176160 RepID=UPI003CCDA909
MSAVTPHIASVNEDEAREPLLPTSASTPPPSGRWASARRLAVDVWLQGKGMILVLASQFFGSSMNVMTQILELTGNNGQGYNPFQILFARMSITMVASYLYMWYAGVPHPFGTRPVLGPLVLRAAGGFLGVYGLYYSVQYLALSEATVLTFLAPILSCYACSFVMPQEAFTRRQQLAAVVSLAGVVLIARPFAPLREGDDDNDNPRVDDERQHLLAIGMGLVGVVGASCAYTTIRVIGQRAHPLVSVTYFSTFTTMASLGAMLVLPSVDVQLPALPGEWALLVGLGVCGFLLQFLLTAGLAYVPPPPRVGDEEEDEGEDKPRSSGTRATSMLYTQMVFALMYDWAIWGTTLSVMSGIGSGLIVGSAMYVAMARG